ALLNLHTFTYSNYRRNDQTMVMPPIQDNEEENPTGGRKKKLNPRTIAILTIAILGLLSGILFVLGGSLFGNEVVVPDLQGMNIKDARDELDDLGLVLRIKDYEFSDEFEKDEIISQEPGKGRKVKKGREIQVVVSKGNKEVKVPNITGIDVKDASYRLSEKGLNLGDVKESYDDRYAEGIIISQKPSAGATVQAGTSVDVVISKGKQPNRCSVPDLRGLYLDAARTKLADQKLVLGSVSKQSSNQYYEGQIMAQGVEPGVLVEEGSSINVVVSTGPGPTTQTKTIDFTLPSDQDYYRVVIKVSDARGEREIYNEIRQGGDRIYITLNHVGSGTVQVFLNGNAYRSYKL
ncbi:MAG TPA: PASTA domain-containing protein, partial [Syntrophomonadaceae bacterium]|nr:PASTA domain-containing protein [Syntrophomonadaceae bacterium]